MSGPEPGSAAAAGARIALFLSEADADALGPICVQHGTPALLTDADDLLSGLRTGSFRATIVGADRLSQDLVEPLRAGLEEAPHGSGLILVAGREDLGPLRSLLETGSATVVERPPHPDIVAAALRAALHASGAIGAEGENDAAHRRITEAHLRDIASSLETRVRERMRDLRAAHDRLLREAEEREAAQARLRDSEELYRFTVELSQQLAWTADVNGTLETISPRFSEITGVDPTVPAHEGWLSAMHPDDVRLILEEWAYALKHGIPHSARFRMRVADGSYHRFHVRAAPRFDDQGRIIRWYGFTEDVEEQERAEERLRESEELYRYTMELGQQIAWMGDTEGHTLSISPQFQAITGLGQDALPLDAIHPEDIERSFKGWRQRIEAGEPFQDEFRLRVRDGSYREFRTRAAPRRDEQGRILRWYGMMEDIHEQKAAQRALLEAEERYRFAARATNDAIWDLDVLGNEIHWSDSASGIFGHPAGKPTSLDWWEDHIHPQDRKRVTDGFRAALGGSQLRWAAAYRFRTMSGSHADVFDRGFIIRDSGGRAVRAVGAMTDVTERRRAEAEIRRMQSELIHVSRLSAMGTMASTLAHELNQPLTAVASYLRGCRRILDGVDTPPELRPVQDALEAAEVGALRAGQIVRRLRELVAKGTVSVASEDLVKLINDAALIAFVDEQVLGVTRRMELDPEADLVSVDRIQIQQVLINLIRNAIQAMLDRPVRDVTIATRAVSRTIVEVSVADTGAGIAEEVREALFSPFQSTKSEGMGIGLSISRTIVEAHGGRIWAEDRPGGGTVFRFTLPRAADHAQADAPDART